VKSKLIVNIKNVRRKKGISQESLAYDLGIDYSTYGKIERGQIGLSVDRLDRIAEILDVSMEELYGWKRKEEPGKQHSDETHIRLQECLKELEMSKKENEALKKRLKDKDSATKILEGKRKKD
jgi:transcriptional regulator with XRE-family HTH domain